MPFSQILKQRGGEFSSIEKVFLVEFHQTELYVLYNLLKMNPKDTLFILFYGTQDVSFVQNLILTHGIIAERLKATHLFDYSHLKFLSRINMRLSWLHIHMPTEVTFHIISRDDRCIESIACLKATRAIHRLKYTL